MMEGPIMPYDARATTAAPLQHTVPAPHFMMNPAYTAAPMANSMVAPQYPAAAVQHMAFDPYNSPPQSIAPSYRPQYPEQAAVPVQSMETDQSHVSYHQQGPRTPLTPRTSLPSRSRSPSNLDQSPAASAKLNPSAAAKKVAPIINLGEDKNEFYTRVDVLMETIQAKPETEEIVKRAEAEVTSLQPSEVTGALDTSSIKVQAPEQSMAVARQGEMSLPAQLLPAEPVTKATQKAQKRAKKPPKHRCCIAGCGKAFKQKTHLTIHIRSHTGEKPFICETCGKSFSQNGNLKTHENRHTGYKPFPCKLCDKRFAQNGNVSAHMKTHLHVKPYECKLEDCRKTFTQLGNLKSHQNRFHPYALADLADKFSRVDNIDELEPADRELWEHLATLYKNSNKGIKGRGFGRRVGGGSPPAPPHGLPAMSTASPQHPHQQPHHFSVPQHPLPMPPQHHHHQHHQSHHQSHHPAAPGYEYGMRGGMMMGMPGGHHDPRGGYEMYDNDSSATASTASGPIYEHERTELAFAERMY